MTDPEGTATIADFGRIDTRVGRVFAAGGPTDAFGGGRVLIAANPNATYNNFERATGYRPHRTSTRSRSIPPRSPLFDRWWVCRTP